MSIDENWSKTSSKRRSTLIGFITVPPQASHANSKDVIIFDLYSEIIFDIERIFRKVGPFRGVNKAGVFQPFDIRWPQDWLVKEIDERLKKEGKFTADVV